MAALSDQMVAQGLVNRPVELLRRYRFVVSTGDCPSAATCQRRRRARERGLHFRPVQLSFWGVGRSVGKDPVVRWEFEAFG